MVAKYETEQCRGEKSGEGQKMQRGKCLRKRSARPSLATGHRLGEKRQPTDSKFVSSTTVLCLKCRSLCTKIQLCWPQHPKEKREKKKGTNSGEESEKSKIQKVTEQIYRKENVRVC